MATKMVSRLETLFKNQAEGTLRSIIEYEQDSFEAVFLRDDVAKQYTPSEIIESVSESRMDSLSVPIYENTYANDHGGLTCLVQCFENVIEMNFVLEDGVGAAVALDSAAFAEAHGLVAEAREIVIEERE